jgi:hypothetical protein
MSRVTNAEVLLARPSEVESVYPIRQDGTNRYRGVGFRRPDGHDFYFFRKSKSDEILRVLRVSGFQVSEAEWATKVWRATP